LETSRIFYYVAVRKVTPGATGRKRNLPYDLSSAVQRHAQQLLRRRFHTRLRRTVLTSIAIVKYVSGIRAARPEIW